MTTALVVVESCFGSTRAIAEAVASGLRDAGARVQVVDAHTSGALPAGIDLLVLGAPTHNRGLPTAASRGQAYVRAGTRVPSSGMREWLARTAVPATLPVAAFDTVSSRSWMNGSAAKAVARTLRRGRGRKALSIGSFLVQGQPGHLADGEEAAARAWGRDLATRMTKDR